MITGFVYKWINKINNKWYIGSHKGTVDDGYRHSSKVLAAAECKYGQNNFVREILFEGNYEDDKIREKEAEYLNLYNAATSRQSYNRTNITGPNCVSEETKRKMSIAHSGENHYNYGKHHTEETKRKIGNAHKGLKKPTTEEHKRNISLAKSGKGGILSLRQVEEIKDKLKQGGYWGFKAGIARKYGVHPNTIYDIERGRTWNTK